MQLIQIGQPSAVTIQMFIEQMSARQSAEIEQLRQVALAKQAAATRRRATVKLPTARRRNCKRTALASAPHATAA